MPLIPIQPDAVGESLQFVNDTADEIGRFLSDALTRVMDRVSPMNAEFFGDARVGSSGGLLLTKLGAHIAFLATHYPERMNTTLARAGQHLTPHADGTVTYDPPPPPVMGWMSLTMLTLAKRSASWGRNPRRAPPTLDSDSK